MTSTIATIKQILAKLRWDPELSERLSDTADIINDVGLDSIEMLQFMLDIEARLAIHIDFDRLEYSYLNSIKTLAEFLDTMPASPPPDAPA